MFIIRVRSWQKVQIRSSQKKGRGVGGFRAQRVYCPLPGGSGCVPVLARWWVTTCRGLPSRKLARASGFGARTGLELDHIHVLTWIPAAQLNATHSPFTSPQRSHRYHMAHSPDPLITWLVLLSWPAPTHPDSSCWHKLLRDPR